MEAVAEAWGVEMRKGHTKLAVLTLLSKESLTGYDLMKKMEERTLGFWRLTPGGVYPILQDLEQQGYLKGTRRPTDNRRRKTYELTEAGKQLLKTALHKQQQIAQTMHDLMSEYAREILNAPLPENLPPPSPPLFSMTDQLNEQPLDVQRRVLLQARERMLTLVQRIDERIAQIAKE